MQGMYDTPGASCETERKFQVEKYFMSVIVNALFCQNRMVMSDNGKRIIDSGFSRSVPESLRAVGWGIGLIRG